MRILESIGHVLASGMTPIQFHNFLRSTMHFQQLKTITALQNWLNQGTLAKAKEPTLLVCVLKECSLEVSTNASKCQNSLIVQDVQQIS